VKREAQKKNNKNSWIKTEKRRQKSEIISQKKENEPSFGALQTAMAGKGSVKHREID